MLLIFDFDGTIADTWDWMAGELVGCVQRFGGAPTDRAALERLRGLGTADVLASLGVSPEALPALVEHIRDRADQATGGFQLFDGMAGLLRDLDERGDTLALVSSNSDATVDATLGVELGALFSVRRCGAGVFDKAAAFTEIVAESGFRPDRVVAIGDETRDVDAADEAGIASLAVTWGYAEASLLRSRARKRTAGDVRELRAGIEAMRYFPHQKTALS